jgi:hypothetical protein
MARYAKIAAVFGVVLLSSCASRPAARVLAHAQVPPCSDRATRTIADNVPAITAHRYAEASRAAERAAQISLGCAASDRGSSRFDDRWRAANAFVVAAELAHQARNSTRARRLLNEGYAIMHALPAPNNASAMTSTLIAEKLDTARRDMHGQWAYW